MPESPYQGYVRLDQETSDRLRELGRQADMTPGRLVSELVRSGVQAPPAWLTLLIESHAETGPLPKIGRHDQAPQSRSA